MIGLANMLYGKSPDMTDSTMQVMGVYSDWLSHLKWDCQCTFDGGLMEGEWQAWTQ